MCSLTLLNLSQDLHLFTWMMIESDDEDAIRALDQTEFGRRGRRLHVEWSKQDHGPRKPMASRRRLANLRPSKTMLVMNFPHYTWTRDLEKHFDPYGTMLNVRMRKNFAYVQYEFLEDATKALDATSTSKLTD
ncbi:hypothetical protein Nepgr_010879 [Nepenthes gracilis]|uniref:RRM domain-containing protein n=1 Tax=Nepenthes gracilis TaxID=150966 RepID=A0AAD3SDS8_NEPGR|nr:hypothetical protein Nepgr_010879 [Nepenthes gracilis]